MRRRSENEIFSLSYALNVKANIAFITVHVCTIYVGQTEDFFIKDLIKQERYNDQSLCSISTGQYCIDQYITSYLRCASKLKK